MPGIKRSLPDEDQVNNNPNKEPLPHRQRRRLEYSEFDSQIVETFNDLADEVARTRLHAARRLLQNLSGINDTSELAQRLDRVLSRLIKGVCSDRKAARLGFSVALAEVIRLSASSKSSLGSLEFDTTLRGFVERVLHLTKPEGNVRGQERRNYLLGRRFAFQAVLQSGVCENPATAEDVKVFSDVIADLAAEKPWLRTECGAVLCEYLHGVRDNQNDLSLLVRSTIDSWSSRGLIKTLEGVALWVTVKEKFPDVKLPKGVWHHGDPFSSKDRPILVKVLLRNDAGEDDVERDGAMKPKQSGTRQSAPSFAWAVIFSYLYDKVETKDFAKIWSDIVAVPMFSSSSSVERKAIGLQIFTQALSTAPGELLEHVVHSNIVRYIFDQRAKSDRLLFEAAKIPLNQMVARVRREPTAALPIISRIIKLAPSNMDTHSKKTFESILGQTNQEQLQEVVNRILSLCNQPEVEDPSQAVNARRMLADMLLSMVRARRNDASQLFYVDNTTGPAYMLNWLAVVLVGLVDLGYCQPETITIPPLTEPTQEIFRKRLMSCLSDLLERPLKEAVLAASATASSLYLNRKRCTTKLSVTAMNIIKQAHALMEDAGRKGRKDAKSKAAIYYAFSLLFALALLEAFNQEPESLGVLEDLETCYESLQESEASSDMLVELLLSFISKPSAVFRKLAGQVFTAFAPNITPESLQSMLDILQQKESMAGQRELFDHHDSDENMASSDEDEYADGDEDLEDASDVEILGGIDVQVNGRSGTGDSADEKESVASSSASQGEDNIEADDEETVFDRKLADALGTARLDDSNDDGSDMDDDQMMALETHLTTIFKERKKNSNKKQENKDAKENMIHFKARVLDLLKKYVESQYANPLALDLIVPLTTFVRTTTSKPTAEKAFNNVLKPYFDSCSKHKKLPEPDDHEACFELLVAVHAEMKLGGSKLHANVCSRASLFLTRVLIAMHAEYFDRIADMYAQLLKEWYHDPKSKIHGNVFTDWQSWVMSTRKHA